MRALLLFARLRLYDTLRSKSSVGFVIVFPVVLLLVVGLVFANGHPFEQRRLVVVGEAEKYRRALARFEEVTIESEPSERAALGKLRARMASAVLLPPPPGCREDCEPRLVVGPKDQLFGKGLALELPPPLAVAVLEVPRFGYVHYLFPGVLAFTVIIAGLFGMGYSLVLYRQNGFLKKLATTPLGKGSFIGGQIAARAALVFVQVAITLATAMVAFGVRLSPLGLVWVMAISLLGLICFLGFGFVLACVVRTEDLLSDVINAANIPIILMSEIFFPLDALPRVMAAAGEWLPSTAMVRLLRAVIVYGAVDFGSLGGGVLYLAVCAVSAFALALALFRWHR